VLQRFVAALRRIDEDPQVRLDLFLVDVLVVRQALRTERRLEGVLLLASDRRDRPRSNAALRPAGPPPTMSASNIGFGFSSLNDSHSEIVPFSIAANRGNQPQGIRFNIIK